MTKIGIVLPPELVAEHNATVRTDPLVETMLKALESERGIRIKFSSLQEAEAARFRYYRARNRAKEKGNHSFDGLMMVFEGTDLLMKKLPPLEIEEL